MAGVYSVEFVVISPEIPAAPAVVPSALFIQQEQREIRNNLPGKKRISSNKLKFKYLLQFRKFSSFSFLNPVTHITVKNLLAIYQPKKNCDLQTYDLQFKYL